MQQSNVMDFMQMSASQMITHDVLDRRSYLGDDTVKYLMLHGRD